MRQASEQRRRPCFERGTEDPGDEGVTPRIQVADLVEGNERPAQASVLTPATQVHDLESLEPWVLQREDQLVLTLEGSTVGVH